MDLKPQKQNWSELEIVLIITEEKKNTINYYGIKPHIMRGVLLNLTIISTIYVFLDTIDAKTWKLKYLLKVKYSSFPCNLSS